MGMFFENIHIHKNDEYNLEQLKKYMVKQMKEKGYELITDNDEGDLSVVIYEPENSEWVSVASDDFRFTSIESINSNVESISKMFCTDVIAASCNDSDYLMLNILNVNDGTDGWINIGSLYGIKKLRRNSIASWKKKVSDYDNLKEITKKQYTFTEDAFYEIAELINMQPRQAVLEADYITDLDNTKVCKLSFIAPGIEKQLPEFVIPMYDLTPCRMGESNCIFVNNRGGKSKGVGVMFAGDYVEKDEITFHDVTFESGYGVKEKIVPVELKKVKLKNGEEAFYWEDRDFIIPPSVSGNIPEIKRMEVEFKRKFGIRFVPRGNSRKTLDIKVVVFPLENSLKGQALWYVYKTYGTKEAYIKAYNEMWEGLNNDTLNPDDFDL